MRTVSVSELKAHLSRYLRTIKRGGEVQVVERGVPIARLTPIAPGTGEDERMERLVRAGIVRPATARWTPEDQEPIDLGTSLIQALEEDREDRF